MKCLLIIVLLLFSINIFAQINNTFPDDGNVGIGTTSPEAKLHVYTGNYGIRSQFGIGLFEAFDCHLDILSSSDATWGSSINLIEGNGSTNTDIWSIVRQTTN